MRIKSDRSCLIIIDVQEKIAPMTKNPRSVITNSEKLLLVAKKLNVPFLVTEQYPKGLGPTMIDIRRHIRE